MLPLLNVLRILGASFVLAVALVASTLSCSSDRADVPLACLDAGIDTTSCTAAYAPTYDALLANTFRPSCTGAGCHSGDGQGGLSFDDADAAYSALLRNDVTPSDPSCSDLVLRVTDPSSTYRMPPNGHPIDAGEQCALAKWVASGAPR